MPGRGTIGRYNQGRCAARSAWIAPRTEQVDGSVQAYVLTGLAMCLILVVSLVATAYLAVYFNRRAKADLEAALSPLAAAIDGAVNLDEAEVTGAWQSWPVYARMANANEGPGRVFQVDIVDAAGGASWQYTSNPPTSRQPERKVEFSGQDSVRALIEPIIDRDVVAVLDPESERYRVEYLVEQGFVRMTRAMRTRRDIPSVDTFQSVVTLLTRIATANREYMESGAAPPESGDGNER